MMTVVVGPDKERPGHQHCDECSCSRDSNPIYRLTDARRDKEGTFVVIIHALPRLPKKGLREKYMQIRRRSADTGRAPYELRDLKPKLTASENGLAMEPKYRIYRNWPSSSIPIDQANIPGSLVTRTCHKYLRPSVILCRSELDTRRTKGLRRRRCEE